MRKFLRAWLRRIEFFIARLLVALPARIQLWLSGRPQLKVAGQALIPEVQLLLAAREWRGSKPLRAQSAAKARRRIRAELVGIPATPLGVGAVEDFDLPGAVGPLRARHYRPPNTLETHAEAPPLLVYFHGGGFVTGDLDTHDAPCRILCRHAGIQVLAVDYRLAPEHPFPAAIDDARAAFRWARAQAESLGADPHRVCVGGDSAGGNLSTVIARMAAIEAEPQPFLQLLIYPPVDRVTSRPSLTLFREGLLLTGEDMDWYNLQYVGDEQTLLADPRVSPLLAPVPPGLCPALIFTAAFDPLRDEGEAYAAALQAAGVPTNWQRIEGQVHGFVNMVDVSPAARRAVVDIARALREHLKIASAKAA